MVSPWSDQRFRRSGPRLSIGLALSGVMHVLCLAGLTLFLTRPGNRIDAEGSEEPAVVVDIGDSDPFTPEPFFGPAQPESGPDLDDSSASGKRLLADRAPDSAGRLPTATAPPAGAGPKRVATAALPAPAVARPAATPVSTRPSAGKRARRPAARSRMAARTAPQATAGSESDRPEPEMPTRPAAQVGTPGPSPRGVFLARMKRHLRAAWRAFEVYARIDPTGRLHGSMFESGLQVRLRADGTLERAELRSSSGIEELDVEAMSALRRIEPLGPVPDELLDEQRGFDVRCTFYLDVGLYRFANELHHAIAREWRPSRAYAATAEQERRTVVRLMLSRQGDVVQADVVSPAGIDFLDQGALSWVRPGLRFPPPPPAFGRGPGPVPIFVAFLHLAGEPRVLKPREDLEAE
jgi:TonB family protein